MIDRFELEDRVGDGGMGTVYRARDRTSGATVAVKLLRGLTELEVERFRKEGALLSELDHPAIVGYVDHGTTASGQPYLAMQWIDGTTLRDRLTRAKPTVADTIAVMRRIADALGAAHARTMIHRDVKPSNVMCPGGRLADAMLIDFGIARRADDVHGLTRTGLIVGSPGYLSPEQARADVHIDGRADVFGLGCLAYECLTGRTPFAGEHLMAVRLRVLMSEPEPLIKLAPNVPRPLAELIGRMLCKRPEGRPASGAEVVAALDALGATDAIARAATEPASGWSELHGACVILGCPDDPVDDLAGAARRLDQVAAAHGMTAATMTDGAFVVTLVGRASRMGDDDAPARAASCALAIRSERPDVTMRIGRLPADAISASLDHQVGSLIATMMRGIFDEAATEADGGAPPAVRLRPIYLDAAIAGVLAAEFEIGTTGVHRILVGRREAP